MDLKTLLYYVDDEKVIQHFEGVAEDKQHIPGAEQNNTEQDKRIKKSVFRNWVVRFLLIPFSYKIESSWVMIYLLLLELGVYN